VISPSKQDEPQAGHPRSGAKAHLCKLSEFACGQGFAPTPHSPVPHWRPSGRAQAPAQPWPKRWPARWVHEQGPQPAARAPARGPALKAWGRKARRVAPCEPPSATLAPPSRPESLRGQIWGLYGPISLSPRAPLSQTMLDLATVPIAGIPPSGRLRPRGRGKPLPCLCAVLWDRELSLQGAYVLLSLDGGLVRCRLGGCYPVRPPPLRLRATARAGANI
jgi:hypothetical protein